MKFYIEDFKYTLTVNENVYELETDLLTNNHVFSFIHNISNVITDITVFITPTTLQQDDFILIFLVSGEFSYWRCITAMNAGYDVKVEIDLEEIIKDKFLIQ